MSFDLNDFFESIKVIVDGRLNDLSYDTTVVATITDDSDKERGHYIVSDGTITFDAYVNDMNYKSGDQVRVSILNGDWSKKKFIIGLYSENTDKGALTYIPPLGDVFSADFSNSNVINDFTLYSNGQETVRRIWGKQITPDSSEYALQANGVYNVITLSGAFQTQLGALSAGGYGLKLDVYSKTEVGSNERINRFMTFDSSEMIGNPYSFVIDSYQQKQIAIGFDGIIDEIVLSIYQGVSFDDKGNEIPNLFYDKDNIEIEELPINFKNLIVGFGSNLSAIEDNSLKFYTPDSTTYKYHNGNGDETNDKRLGLIWYNKNENNEYVGYSDGVYDTEYDEIQYLKFAHTDSRLTRNIGKTTVGNDELSLTLAANIEESQPYMQNIYEALTTSLSSELQALGREISGWESLKTQLNQLIASYVPEGATESVPAKLVQARETTENATQNWANLYAKVLQHGYNLQNDIYTSVEKRNEAVQEIEDWFNDADTGCAGQNPFAIFNLTINGDNDTDGIIDEINALFTTMELETRVDSPMAGYRSIYNNYKARVDRVLKEIEVNMSKIIVTSKIEWIKDVEDDDFNWFSYYKTHIATTDYPPYEKPESTFAEYANKYCMYLYRYVDVPTLVYNEEEEPDSENNIEYTFGRFLGPNWERVKLSKDENGNNIPVLNPYLPGEGETIDTEVVDENGNKSTVSTTYHKASSEEEIFLNLRMEPTKDIEKYQIVFFHNHEQILSNVLVFTNLEAEDIPPQFTVNANDIIQIEHGSYSQDHYQAYSQANDLVNIADESRRRMLQCTYDGILSGNEALAGAEIFWYMPLNSTMLTYDRKYLVEDLGFFSDIDKDGNRQATELSKDGYVYFSKTIGYDSEEIPSVDAENNPIYDSLGNEVKETKITIHPEDRTFCYKIKPYYEHSAQNNTIYVEAHIKDSENRVSIVKGELPLTFSSFGTNGTNYTLVFTPNTSQIASLPPTILADELLTEDEWNALADDNRLKTIYDSYNAYYEAESVNSLLVLNLALRNGDGELLTLNEGFTIIQDDSDEEEINTQNLKINWYATNGIADSVLTLLESAEGAKERLVEVSRAYDETIPYVGVANATVEFQEELSDGTPRTLRLSTMYPIPYSSSGSYYISGPTMIVYNNQGTVSRCSDEPFKLFQHTINGDKEITDYSWYIEYYKDDGTHLKVGSEDYQNIIAYMPKLDYQKNTLLPAPMYTAFAGETAIIPVIICGTKDAEGNYSKIVWTQPIVITQNNYASSTLNQWNGEFQINETNGTILSTMIGAGIKTDNNTFEGVLMGDIQKGVNFDSNNADGIGIYGFHDGSQSFYFGVNGTAFIGKSARGRIKFDGNSGTIASASYYATRTGQVDAEGAGMLIDLDDGFIDIRGVNIAENPDYTGSTTYEIDVNHQAHITLNAKADDFNPYFRITSPRINAETEWENMDLIYVGLDGYYLQSSNYKKPDTAFTIADNQPNTPGSGMKIDLQGAFIDAFNLRLQSQNLLIDCVNEDGPYFVIKSGSTDEELTSFRNLMYVGTDTYYLQTADYKENTSGLKIDLANGTIKAYNSFSLEAGTETDGGVMLNANPGSGENYLFAGKTSVGYIKIDNSGNMGLMATIFTLKTNKGDGQDIYLSNTITNWTLGSGDTAVTKTNILFGVGTKFAVDNKGNLYANDATINNLTAVGGSFSGTISSSATISGGIISGGKIVGAEIYVPTEQGSLFSVTSAGRLTATSAEIGGWEVGAGESDGFRSGNLVMSPSSGLNYNENFTVDKDGNLKATSAVFDTSLTVKSSRTGGKDVFTVNSDGNTVINGYLTIGANYIYLTADETSGAYIYASTATDTFLVKNASTISLEGTTINIGKAGSTINLGTSTGDASSTYAQGNLYFKSNIYTHNGTEYKAGYTKNVTISSWTMGDVSFTFVNGICTMVSGGTATESGDISGGSDIPDIGGNSNKYLQVNSAATGLEWQTAYPPTSKGSSGQVWTSNGSDGEPGWSTPSSSVDWTSVTNKPSGLTGSYRRVYSVAKGSSNGTIKYRYSDLYFTDGILTSAGTLTWSGDITIYTAPSSE